MITSGSLEYNLCAEFHVFGFLFWEEGSRTRSTTPFTVSLLAPPPKSLLAGPHPPPTSSKPVTLFLPCRFANCFLSRGYIVWFLNLETFNAEFWVLQKRSKRQITETSPQKMFSPHFTCPVVHFTPSSLQIFFRSSS